MTARPAPPADVRVVPGILDPATWPHTRSFLAIVEESGIETARAQFFLTHAEAEAVCVWARGNPNLRGTVVILSDDPETEDFRDPGRSPAGRIDGSEPPDAAVDANAIALAAAHSANAAAHDLVGLAIEGATFPGYVSHQIVQHLADALVGAIDLHGLADDEGDPLDLDLLHIRTLTTRWLEEQNG